MADADLSFPQFANQLLDVLVALAPDRGIRLRTGPGHVADLGEGVRVEVLPHKLAEAVLDACSYPGRWRGGGRATRQFDALCAFVRIASPDPTPTIQWDREKAISTTVILSRLVRPNPVGYEYACRIQFDDEGMVEMIAPGCQPGPGSSAYVHDLSRRLWLDQTDLNDLAALGDALRAWPSPRPPAFMRALRYHEMACWQWEARIRTSTIATAWDALVDSANSIQFAKRVSSSHATLEARRSRR